MSKTKKGAEVPDVVYGDVEIEGELRMEDAKVKISLYLDGDLLLELKKAAEKEGEKYQPFTNKLLRKVIMGESKGPLADRVAILEKEMKKLIKKRDRAG